jgi:hypothetical protein
VEGIHAKLQDGLQRLLRCGLEPEEIARQSMLTPACGMGTMDTPAAARVLEMLPLLSKKCRQNR